MLILPDKSSKKPDEWLFKLIVAFGGNIIILKILLSVESDLLGLDFSVLDIDLVSNQDNRNVLAHSDQVLVPLGHVLVSNSGAHIEHDNSAISTNAK